MECVDHVNSLTDVNGISLPRKAMIRCGLAKDVHGIWRTGQLSQELRDIILRHPAQFSGSHPNSTIVLDDTESE